MLHRQPLKLSLAEQEPLRLFWRQGQGLRILGEQAGQAPLMQHEGADEQYPHEQGEHHQPPQHQRGQPMTKTGEEVGKLQGVTLIAPAGHRHPTGTPHHVEQLGDEAPCRQLFQQHAHQEPDHYHGHAGAHALVEDVEPGADPDPALPYGVASGFAAQGAVTVHH